VVWPKRDMETRYLQNPSAVTITPPHYNAAYLTRNLRQAPR